MITAVRSMPSPMARLPAPATSAGSKDGSARLPRRNASANPVGDLGKLMDHGVIVLIALTAASVLLGSYTAASHSRELLPVMVVTTG